MSKIILLLVCVHLIIKGETGINLMHPQKHFNKALSLILQQYDNYNVILHIDNTTMYQNYYFMENTNNNPRSVLVLNYDKEYYFHRPAGYKFLNIVFLSNPFHFGEFAKIPFNLEYNDVVLILTKKDMGRKAINPNLKMSYFWQQHGIDRAGSIFVFDLLNNQLYYECFFCGNRSGVLTRVPNRGKDVAMLEYSNKFSDFHGQKFKIGYMSYNPYFSSTYGPDGYEIHGPEGKLLQLLSELLNFEFNLINFNEQAYDKWRAMVDAVHQRQLDWAVGGISSSTKRSEITDLTRYIHTEKFTVLFHHGISNNSWQLSQQVLLPFTCSLWLYICAMLIVMVLLLKKSSQDLDGGHSLGFLKIFEITVRGLIEQPLRLHRLLTEKMVVRFLLIAWWYSSIIITTAYRSKLASSLIEPLRRQPDSIQELLQLGYTFQVNNEDWSMLKENLELSIDHTYTDVLKKSYDHLDMCSAIALAIQNKVAVIDEATTLEYEVNRCHVMLYTEGKTHFRVTAQKLFPSYHIWPLQLGAPYRYKFSKMIENLRSSGILNAWYDLVTNKQLPLSNQHIKKKEFAALPLTAMYAPISILFVGLVSALVVFLCEVLYYVLNYVFIFYRRYKRFERFAH